MAAALPPILSKPIPEVSVNVGGKATPFDLKLFIESPNPESGEVRFFAELSTGDSLPEGIECSEEGIFTGTAEAGTEGDYQIVIFAENDSGIPLRAEFSLKINASTEEEETLDEPTEKSIEFLNALKSQVWEAVGKEIPIPDMHDIYNRPLSAIELYYLLERFAVLTIWDVYNLDQPGDRVLLNLKDASPHYNIYDRGSCIIGAPKELFSYERTLEDSLQTARAIGKEVYKRGWTVQLAGFEKMSRAAWVEIQNLGELQGKPLEVLHYIPTAADIRICNAQLEMRRILGHSAS